MITHEIIGDDMPAVILTLAAGDEKRAEAGAITYMTNGIEMDARQQRSSGKGRLHRPVSRKIIRVALQNSAVLCQRDCAAGEIDINIEFAKRRAGSSAGKG